ncbi:alkaline phosphatase [Gammaproteobacteria bacterium]|jgi:alkaline phosphatase|nr:alkaline phosphatase [Gammaproteobacteria bacterium]MEC8448821.1 alkaline phosphatase [Pseudomonadota bacterium]
MKKILYFLKKNALVILISFSLGGFAGYKVLESLGIAFLLSSIPIPEGSIADKDAFIETLPEGKPLSQKAIIPIKNKPKNIILLISDGMSLTQVSTYRLLKGGPNERIAVDKFPVSGIVLTHSENAIVTDSASSATAFSTGRKTNNGALGLDEDNKILENFTEIIDRYGYVSSLISTSEITHATPAAYASHVDLRWKTDEISLQMMESNVMTILGGGRHFFLPEDLGGKRSDGLNLLEQMESSRMVMTEKKELDSFDHSDLGKVVGLFADEALRDKEKPENHVFEPSSSEMLNFAINRSEKFNENGCKGFFIMLEGSQVDWAGHANDLNYLKREMQDFDEAVELALDYATQNQDTLVIATADHETGGLLIESSSPTDYTAPEVKFSFNTGIGYGSHTGVPVPVYAYGPGSENFTGTLDNTDIFYAMLEAVKMDGRTGSCVN